MTNIEALNLSYNNFSQKIGRLVTYFSAKSRTITISGFSLPNVPDELAMFPDVCRTWDYSKNEVCLVKVENYFLIKIFSNLSRKIKIMIR